MQLIFLLTQWTTKCVVYLRMIQKLLSDILIGLASNVGDFDDEKM